jgi:hypothetical protein
VDEGTAAGAKLKPVGNARGGDGPMKMLKSRCCGGWCGHPPTGTRSPLLSIAAAGTVQMRAGRFAGAPRRAPSSSADEGVDE